MKKRLLLAGALAFVGCSEPKASVPTCEWEGAEVSPGAPCDCEDGAEGSIACDDAASCVCDGTNNMTDMSTSDTGNNTTDTGGGDDTGGDTGAPDLGSDTGTMDMGTDAGMLRERGDCVTDDDCSMDTWMCISIPAGEPGGHFTCQADDVAEPGCATIEAPDNCCRHTDCTDDPSGKCVIGPIFYCGGIAPMIANVCMYDECATDGDCAAGELCMPPRALGEPVSRCLAAECGTDADCDDRAGGECHMFRNPCNGRVSGFFCTYDDSECRTNDDCPDDPDTAGREYCAPGPEGGGDTTCAPFLPPP